MNGPIFGGVCVCTLVLLLSPARSPSGFVPVPPRRAVLPLAPVSERMRVRSVVADAMDHPSVESIASARAEVLRAEQAHVHRLFSSGASASLDGDA